MANFKFFKDQLREETEGKYSSKKVWGAIVMALVSISYILDGMSFYNIDSTLFNSFLIAGTTLLGLRAVSKVFTKGGSDVKEN